jgi:energy-coupling factor transport system ATP-binding protein
MNKTGVKDEKYATPDLEPGSLTAFAGPNFSGRTTILRKLTGLDTPDRFAHARWPSSYIWPEVYNAISGIVPTVREELELHLSPRTRSVVWEAAGELNLSSLYGRNPFTLSGGEQAFLVLLCGLGLNSQYLSIDCALEQVSPKAKETVLELSSEDDFAETAIALADNRLEEYEELVPNVTCASNFDLTEKNSPLHFGAIDPDVELPVNAGERPELSIEDVSFSYESGSRVLKQVDARLKPGNLYMLLGENGAGKSTLAKLMCGVLEPDTGQVTAVYEGEPDKHTWDYPGRLVAYHFQNPDLQFFGNHISEEIMAGPLAYGLNRETCLHRRDMLMQAFGLAEVGGKAPLDLDIPFSVRKRVAIASTLATGCNWIVLDEPTLAQDDTSAETIAQMVEDLLERGVGVILVSHSEWFRSMFSYQPLLLEDGALETDQLS